MTKDEALRKAAETFRQYETHHAAKGSIDGDTKARSNAQMAEMCEAALSEPDALAAETGRDEGMWMANALMCVPAEDRPAIQRAHASAVKDALAAKEAECERLREMLGDAQNQMIEAANSMTLRGMPVHAKKLDGIIDRIDAALEQT